MKKIYTLIIISSFLFINHSMGQCNQIAMIGEFSGWAGDLDMIRDTVNPDLWTLPVVFTAADDLEGDGIIQMKFREHGDWNYNWGNIDFPSGVAVFYGLNVPVPYGAWDVSFNCVTLEYNFQVQIGLEESPDLNHGFMIWPNPAKNQVNIKLPGNLSSAGIIFSLSDLSGRVVMKQSFLSDKQDKIISANINGIGPGVYFIRLLSGDKNIYSDKLIVLSR